MARKGTVNTRNFADYFINFFGWNSKFPLNSKADINLATKTIAYQSDDIKNNPAVKRMFNYLVREAGDDNKKLREMNDSTRYILRFPKLKGAILENFFEYKKI